MGVIPGILITSLKGAIDEKMFFSKMAIGSDIFSSSGARH
jgi:hypothetical protein